MTLTFTIDGKSSSESFPGKESGYTGTAICEAGVEASWDSEEWSLVINNSNNQSNIVCNIDFKIPSAVEYITNLANTSSEIVDDETTDHNLRYIGKDPNNYIQFNGELWRIIGVMTKTYEQGDIVRPRLRIIRSESIGNYSWDNKASGTGSSTSEYGSNDWEDSAIQKVLNQETFGRYYNRLSGKCPSGSNGATTECDFRETGLTNEAKNMISNIVWKLGYNIMYNIELPSELYGREKLGFSWNGKVGLMYPSDYGYATGGGSTTDRDTCLNVGLRSWDESGVSDCKSNDWLYTGNDQWTIVKTSGNDYSVHFLSYDGEMNDNYAKIKYSLRPVVHLNVDTIIQSGTGSSDDPYILAA